MGKPSLWSSQECISRHGMGKDQGVWVLSTTAGLGPVQPGWKPGHNRNQTLARRPLGNIPLFNAELDARQVMASLVIMSHSHPHVTPFFLLVCMKTAPKLGKKLAISTAKQLTARFWYLKWLTPLVLSMLVNIDLFI